MQNGLCHLEQQISTNKEIHTVPLVIMTSDQVWDPSFYDDKISTLEHLKHLSTIPVGENEELYDIKGNLDIETSLFNSTHTSNLEVILVKIIKVDKFEDQDAGTINVVADMHTVMLVPGNVTIEKPDANAIVLFILVDSTINIDGTNHVDPNNPTTQKNISFVISLPDQDNGDNYVP